MPRRPLTCLRKVPLPPGKHIVHRSRLWQICALTVAHCVLVCLYSHACVLATSTGHCN